MIYIFFLRELTKTKTRKKINRLYGLNFNSENRLQDRLPGIYIWAVRVGGLLEGDMSAFCLRCVEMSVQA